MDKSFWEAFPAFKIPFSKTVRGEALLPKPLESSWCDPSYLCNVHWCEPLEWSGHGVTRATCAMVHWCEPLEWSGHGVTSSYLWRGVKPLIGVVMV